MSGAEETPAGLALRAIQKHDEIAAVLGREFLIAAEDQLGAMLGLTCTGVKEDVAGVAYYSHNDTTCPIHEWLVESDQKEAEAWLENRTTS